MKEIQWQADTKKEMANLPVSVRKDIGLALYAEQINKPHPAIKPLKGFKQTVREIKSSAPSVPTEPFMSSTLAIKFMCSMSFKKRHQPELKRLNQIWT